VIASELALFNWTKWPLLDSLDFENNYTLNNIPNLPKTLKSLRIAYTNVDVPQDIHGLQSMSCSLHMNAETYRFFQNQKCLDTLMLHFKDFLKYSAIPVEVFFTCFEKLKLLQVHFCEYFATEDYIFSMCKVLPNTLVQRKYPAFSYM
jgi:hypothetical protein